MSVASGSAAAPVRVKICGVTSVADARAAVAAGADMIGLNFYSGSKRCITLERAREIVAVLPAGVWRVGLFVNATRGEIEHAQRELALDAIQLHGDEPPEMGRGFAVPVIRALRLTQPGDAARDVARYVADYFLCEGDAGAAYGGAGRVVRLGLGARRAARTIGGRRWLDARERRRRGARPAPVRGRRRERCRERPRRQGSGPDGRVGRTCKSSLIAKDISARSAAAT